MMEVKSEYKMTELFEIPYDWKIQKLEDILTESRVKIERKEENINKRISVRLNLKGVTVRESRDNDAVGKTVYYKRSKGQFIYGKQNLDKGALGIIPEELDGFHTSQDIPAFDIKKDVFSSWFFYYISQESFYKGLQSLSKGTGSKRIHPKDLLKLEIIIPPINEQQKIAKILSTVDEQIEQTDQLIEKTKELKKGLMQQLLTKGIRHTKFKETIVGTIPMDWKYESIESVAERKSGHTPDKKITSYWEGTIPWISLADLSKLDKRFIFKTKTYTTKEGIENSSAIVLPKGTVVISRDAAVGKIGIMGLDMATSQHYINYICGEKLNNIYLYYYLLFHKKDFERIAIGSTIKTIGLDFFKKMKILIPTIYEQQKIASILSSVDEDIEGYEEEKVEYEELKKGLMQKLLTGKTRVKVD